MVNQFERIDEPLSISDILGNVITFSDYSSFAVRFLDRWKIWFWSPGQKNIVTENTNQKYPYKLNNTGVSFGKIASAKIISHGTPPEIPYDAV